MLFLFYFIGEMDRYMNFVNKLWNNFLFWCCGYWNFGKKKKNYELLKNVEYIKFLDVKLMKLNFYLYKIVF